MKKITIIGSGALGTALANILKDANAKNDVLIYGIDQSELNDLKQGKNKKYFDNIELNNFNVSNNLIESISNVDYIVLALPSTAIDSVMNQIVENLKNDALIINGCKGFYPKTETPDRKSTRLNSSHAQ